MRQEKLLPWRCFVKVDSRISRIRDVPRRIANWFFGRAFPKRAIFQHRVAGSNRRENGSMRSGFQITRLEIHVIGFTVPADAF
jgi:hypothetical protein